MNRCMSDACQQGRKPCPFPIACEMPEPLTARENAEVLATIAIACIGLGSAIALVCGWFQ